MPLLSSRTSACWDELELTCLLSLSMLLISTSFPDWPNAMMARFILFYKYTMSPLVAAKNEESQVAKEGLEVIIRTMLLYKTKIEDVEVLKKNDTAKMAHPGGPDQRSQSVL